MIQRGLLPAFDTDRIAEALHLPPRAVIRHFRDGRRIGFIVEHLLAEWAGGELMAREGGGYDCVDASGGRWEIRCLTEAIFFCPSAMVGAGRRFDEAGFLKKLHGLRGYLIADVTAFPDVPFWQVPVEDVTDWWAAGKLGPTTRISHRRALELLDPVAPSVGLFPVEGR